MRVCGFQQMIMMLLNELHCLPALSNPNAHQADPLSVLRVCVRVCVSLMQMLMMLLMSYTAYLSFKKLMIALEDKGFVDRGSRPTIKKVCVCA